MGHKLLPFILIAFDYGGNSCLLYHYACMAEMAFGTLQSSTDIVNAPPKECMKPLTGVPLKR